MNIVVIDDEKIIANGFYSLISQNFKEHNVFVFYKSLDLLEYSKNNQIDLLICDIDMPIKNGIDLAKELKEFLPNLEIIFLTGMDTFDYIYKANKVKDSKYLLKIEEDETIISTIKDTIQKIEEISMNDKNTLALRNENEQLHKESKLHHLNELLNKGIVSEKLDIKNLYFNVLFLSKKINHDEYKKLENLLSNAFSIKIQNIFLIDETKIILFSKTIIDETIFDEVKNAYFLENAITLNICVASKVVEETKINIIYSRMCDLAKISDLSKGFFYMYENEVSQDLDDNQKLMAAIKDYIYKNTDGDLSLKKIGLVMHYNESYLSRLFKKQTGTNFKNFVTEIKLEKAVHLLSETDILVKDIAKNLGFESTSHFQYFFKKNLGMTPQEYRHEHIKTE